MQTLITCSSCGTEMSVEQPAAGGVFACPSCGVHFEIPATELTHTETEIAPESLPKKPKFIIPGATPPPVQPQSPPVQHPGMPMPRHGLSSSPPTTFTPRPANHTIPIIIGSIAALTIICVTLIVINSNNSKAPAVAAAPPPAAKPSQADIRKGIEEKAKEMLDASAPSVERAVNEAKAEQNAFEEMQEHRRKVIGAMYGEKIFDGDEDAGYQLAREIEEVMERMPTSEKKAEEMLRDRFAKNEILKPHMEKIEELLFNAKKSKGPMAFLNEYESFGTGFFISDDGWIISNHHVVGDAEKVDVRMSDGTTHHARVVKKDDEFDLALLKVEAKAPKSLPVSKGGVDLSLGREVFTIGFPNPTMQGVAPKYTDGKVSATAGMGDDKNFYQVSVPVQPGNSGGALVDAGTGWCVGVITLRLENTADGRSAQNVSYAIKSSAVHQFIEKFHKNGSETIKLATAQKSTPEASIDLAKNASVQILLPREDEEDDEEEDEEE
jgi:serine protease Do